MTLIGRMLPSSKPFSPGSFQGVRLRCWFHNGVLFYAEYNIRLFFYFLTHDYSIACACDLDTVLPIRLVSGWKRKKTVYDAHEFFTEVPEIASRPFVKSIWSAIANVTIRGFDLRYTVGSCLAGIMSEKYKVTFHVIRNIPSHTQTIRTNSIVVGKKILLYQGALNEGRGLETIIDAMVHLPEWEFWLAGEGDITGLLKKQVNQNQISNRVNFLGWVHPNDLPDLMTQATLGINLREAGSLNDFYSLPNKFFDFIHAGLPSINMKYPEYESIINEYPCAMLIDEASSKNIIEAVDTLFSDPQLLQGMRNACKAAAQVYTWENESRRLLDLYAALVSVTSTPHVDHFDSAQ